MTGRRATAAGVLLMGAGLTSCAAQDTPVPATPDVPAPAASTPGVASDYRDGQYTATGWYGSLPSHQEVTLTIRDDTVTAVEITTPAEDDTSLGYQQRFAAALPDAIIGKDIDTIDIDRLAGASGCSEGFMNALIELRDAALKTR